MICSILRRSKANRIIVTLMLLVFGVGGVESARGQSDTAVAGADEPKVAPSDSKSDVHFSVESDTRFGILTYVPEQWGELHLRLENTAAVSRDLLCTSYFGLQPTLQFGRQVWLPPRSRLSLPHPIFVPKADQFRDHIAEIHSLVIDRTSGNEVLQKDESGQLRHDRSLLVTPTARNSGVVAGWDSEDAVPQDVLDLMVAGRVNQGLNNSVTVLTGQFLPADETSLSYLDHIVLAENRLIDDFAALAALRRWLHAGGRVWIMLDRTDPALVERLLGDDFNGYLVDRVGLTSVRVDKAPFLLNPEGETGETIEYDEPVEMARVVVSGMKVWNSVDGWPAAMTGSFGEGRVLMTTLGPRGWMKPAPPSSEPRTTDRLLNSESKFVPLSPMEDLAAYVFSKRDPEPLSQNELESLAQEFVSYRIPSWALIIGIMCGFLALLSAIGVWLWRIEHLEHFGWIGSLVAVLFGILFTGIGVANRYGVPETIASVQLAQAMGGADDVQTQGMIAVYRREGNSSLVQTAQGGRLWPDTTDIDGQTCRMVTTDLGKFRWEGLPQPAGLRMYPDATSRSFAKRIAVHATLDSEGIVGRFTGSSAGVTDAILATRYGRMGAILTEVGEFRADSDDVLETDQFLDAAFLGDVQDRRQRILKQLFDNRNWKDSLVRPQLMVWLNDWDHGFQFGEGLLHQGETLMIVPVELARPPAGTEMAIPSPLISYAPCRAPDGSLPSGFWDDSRGEWQERSSPSTTWLSCQLPRSVLPVKVTRARLNIKVSGAMGQIEILGVKNGSEATLQSVKDPVGSLRFEIDDPSVLAVSTDGELRLGVKAGVLRDSMPQASAEVSTGNAANYWRIESLTLQLWAVTTELSAED